MIFSPHDSPFILVFTADARFVGGSHPSCFFTVRRSTGGKRYQKVCKKCQVCDIRSKHEHVTINLYDRTPSHNFKYVSASVHG